MNWTDKVIPFHLHPLGLINAFTQLGADLAPLLEAVEVPRPALKSITAKISYQQFLALIRSGMNQCEQPALGLLASQHFDWVYHGVTGMAMRASSTFSQAGLAFQRYSCLAQPYYMPFRCNPFFYLDNRLRVIIPIEHLISAPEQDAAVYRFEVEFRLGLLFQMLIQCSGQAEQLLAVARVELDIDPPTDRKHYDLLGCKNTQFNCRYSRLVLPAASINREGDILRKGIYKQALEYCNQELRKVTVGAPDTEHVRTLLVENLPTYPCIDAVAERMGLTSRTLARRLKQENTSFTDLLNQIRSEVATYLLRATRLSTDDIAESLGFADTNNFRQAFLRWTGQSSSEYRRQLAAANKLG